MITIEQYFAQKLKHREVTQAKWTRARDLLRKVNSLLVWVEYTDENDPDYIDLDTGSQISGERGGDGDGGFRLSTSKTGTANSTHKQATGVDVYDPEGRLDNLLNDDLLRRWELYREHPKATPGWCHLQSTPPKSKRRTYIP